MPWDLIGEQWSSLVSFILPIYKESKQAHIA